MIDLALVHINLGDFYNNMAIIRKTSNYHDRFTIENPSCFLEQYYNHIYLFIHMIELAFKTLVDLFITTLQTYILVINMINLAFKTLVDFYNNIAIICPSY